MTDLLATARFLQIPSKGKPLSSPFQLLEQLDKGLPVSCVDKISDALAPMETGFRYRIVPKATLARMKAGDRLNKNQGALVTRLAEVWTDAVRVWKTDEEARSFLSRRHPLLENNRPLDLALQSEIGAQLVRDVLGRLEHGTAV